MKPINQINVGPDRHSDRFAANLDWNLLRTFVAIVEEGSITRAAHRLLRGQPAISLALQRLESEMETRLIDRARGEFSLTPAGQALFRECRGIYGDVARLHDVTTALEHDISGQVSILLASHVVTPILDDLLSETNRAHPAITYRFRTTTSASVAAGIRDKSASFGICLVNQRLPGLAYDLLYREFFGFFCGPGHPLFGRDNLSLDDLHGHDAVAFETDDVDDSLRPVALLRQQYALDQKVIGRSSHLEEVRRMILCGMGIGALPIHVVERDLRDGLLWRLPPYEGAPRIDIFLLTNPAKRFNRAETALIDGLRARIAALPLEQRTYPSR